jgi:hypothetical protein
MTAFTSFSFGICNDPFSLILTPLVRYDCLEFLFLNLGSDIFGPFLLPVTDLKKLSYAIGKAIHLWIRDHAELSTEQKALLDVFIDTKYKETNSYLRL